MLGIYLLGNIRSKFEQNNGISRTQRGSPFVGKVVGQFHWHVFLANDSSRATPCEGRRVRDQHKYMEFFNITPYTTEGQGVDDDCYIPGTEEPKSTISRWVLLVYKIILLSIETLQRTCGCGALSTVTAANHRRRSGVGYPDEFTRCCAPCAATLALYYETKPVLYHRGSSTTPYEINFQKRNNRQLR